MPKLRQQLPHSIYFKYGTSFILDEMNLILLLLLKQLIIILIISLFIFRLNILEMSQKKPLNPAKLGQFINK
jgi:hypothetical protein